MQDYCITPRPETSAATMHPLSPPPVPVANHRRICAVAGGPCLPPLPLRTWRIAFLKPRGGAFHQVSQGSPSSMQDCFLTPRLEPPASAIHSLSPPPSPPPSPAAKRQRICAVAGGPLLPLIHFRAFDARGGKGPARRIAFLKPRGGAFHQVAEGEQTTQPA